MRAEGEPKGAPNLQRGDAVRISCALGFRVVILVGLLAGGVHHSSAMEQVRRWTAYREEDGLYHNIITAVVETHDRAVWFATIGGGISRYDGHTWRTFTTVDGLPGNTVVSLFETEDGTLWALSAGGPRSGGPRRLARLVGDEWELAKPSAESSLDVSRPTEWPVAGGRVCVAVDRGVLFHVDGAWRALTTEDGLASDRVRCALRDREGGIWVSYDHRRRPGLGRGLGYGRGARRG